MFLSDAELKALTRRLRTSAQRKVLASLGVPYRLRPDGSIVVLHADLQPTTAPQRAPMLRLPTRAAA